MSFCPLFIVVKSNSSDKEKMSLTSLTLSLNEDFRKNPNFTDYNTTANECISFFEGVYEYGCPGKRTTACFPETL